MPNTYEASLCQATNCIYERIFRFSCCVNASAVVSRLGVLT